MDTLQPQTSPAMKVRDFFFIIRTYKLRWLLPAIVISGAVGAYAFTMPETWEVSQGVMVRNNAVAKDTEPGEFESAEPMRRTEETIVEVCTSAHVLGEALESVGPPADWTEPAMTWPNEKSIESLRATLSIEAPNGAEFGTTEVFYVKVQADNRERALALLVAICESLRSRMGEIRNDRADGLLFEVGKTVALAQADLDVVTLELKQMEQGIGTDLVELRILHQSPNGQGDLVPALIAAEQELVAIQTMNQNSKDLLELLDQAKEDADVLVSAPPDLLSSHPTLGHLRGALVEAQLRIAALKKNLTDEYPTVKAAIAESGRIRERLSDELENAQRVVKTERKLRSGRLPILQRKRSKLHARLEKLASIRAEYNNLVNLVGHRQDALERAEQRLADVRARQAVARSASIISLLDAPESSSEPIGPGRASVVLVGIVGGMMSGFGFLFLTVAEQPTENDTATVRLPAAILQTVGVRPTRHRNLGEEERAG